nr:DNA polymerase I [Tanacetum cinerariifolium]
SQVELRIMADFSGDATMIEAFRLGQDVHSSTASKVFKVPLSEVDGEMRRKAKTVNFVHDELVFDAVREEVDYVTPKIRELMTTALLLPHGVPLEVEVGTGDNWLKAH